MSPDTAKFLERLEGVITALSENLWSLEIRHINRLLPMYTNLLLVQFFLVSQVFPSFIYPTVAP